MKAITKLQLIGVLLFVIFILGGIIGTFYGIYSSFGALDSAEHGGIGPVGDGLRTAIIFAIVAIVGSVIGIILFVVGTINRRKAPSS